MYGWERRNGALADHFAETITDDDVVRTLERTRRALVPEAKPPAESHIESVAPSEVVQVDDATPLQIAPVTPTQQGSDIPVDCIRTASADQRVTHQTNWPDMKLAGTEAFGRGSYHAAAVHFCSAIAVVEKAPTPLPERHTEILAGLHSNHSAALLLSGDSFGALRAAEQCVATRPGWEKAHFRKGEALFASRRFAEARTAYADAIDAERASTANTENTAQGNTNESTFHCPSLLTLRLAAASRAATDASVLDHQETALRDARAAAVTESEGKKEATSDANINKLNAEAEDRERDPRARALMKDIEKLFLDARAEMKEEKGETGKEREDTEKEKKFDEEKNDTDETRAGTNAVRDDAPAETAPEEESTKNGKKTFGKKPKGPNARVALSLLNALLSIEPENADASFQAAMLSLRDGDVIGAVTYGRMCVDRAPGFARGADLLATCLEMTEEGGDRTRGDAAVAARLVPQPDSGNENTAAPSPSESEAEMALTIGVASNPDSPECWCAFARHLTRRGFLTDAVASLRAAIAGGPEAKWLKPRSDPGVMVTLGYLVHIRGHVAEPASLYTSAAQMGGGFIASTLFSAVAFEMGDEDDTARLAKRAAARDAFVKHPIEIASQIEALNVSFQPPQFERAARKNVVAALLRDARCRDVAPCVVRFRNGAWANSTDVIASGVSYASDETNESGGNHVWILKAFRHAFEGDKRAPRVFKATSSAELSVALVTASARPETATVQRFVSGPKTRGGREVTVRFFAKITGVEDDESTTKTDNTGGKKFACSVSDGFVIRSARGFDATSENEFGESAKSSRDDDFIVDCSGPADADAWATATGVGFGVTCDEKVTPGSETARETAASVDSVDWHAVRTEAHRKACKYFTLAEKIYQTPVGEFCAYTAWRRSRLPKLVELVFVLDEFKQPWLVDVEPFPSISKYAQNAQGADVGVALRFAARAYDLVE